MMYVDDSAQYAKLVYNGQSMRNTLLTYNDLPIPYN